MDCPKRNAMAGLPDEAMLEILARTPFRSVCRSKCVAKSWRDLIDDPLNRRRLPQTLQGFFHMFIPMRKRDDDSDFEYFFIKYLASPLPLDIDPCLSFLMKLPETTESVDFLDSCNGLLLFKHYTKSNPDDVLSYVVCNPTTKHWGTVPICACCPPPKALLRSNTYLAYDLAVSPHFHLIQFWEGSWHDEALSVHTYSSEMGVWSHSQTDWNEPGQLEGWRRRGRLNNGCDKRAFVNGLLHLMVSYQHQIVAVDVQGKTKWIITTPDATFDGCIGQSQGRLRYIKEYFDDHVQSSELFIWELQDYDTQEWMCKDTVSFLILFGTMTAMWDYVFIHPDCNVVFLLQPLNKLIAYGMDYKEVSVVFMSSEKLKGQIVPYIPSFAQSPALTNEDWMCMSVCSDHGAASNLVGL